MAKNDWQVIEPASHFSPNTLAETLDGGQAFRWKFNEEVGAWQGIFDRFACLLKLDTNSDLLFQSLSKNKAKSFSSCKAFLRSSIDWASHEDSLPWRSDTHMKQCLESFRGLRILKQPFGEALLAFMCSATKQIPQIKVMCQNLAQTLGSPLGKNLHAMPTWEQVAEASETQLRSLALGFRAKNIKKTADLIAADSTLLKQIEQASYEDAKSALVEFPGVGEKIADCALLFGTDHMQAFPVDTWIIKVLEKRYELEGWDNKQLAQFGRIHFGPLAGFAQQFLFSWERTQPKVRA
ncbi:hypothetical protein MLD52_14585 [Puniceicoccaceae bacterium K14]|nr:hypothetical protein [Puniceicoccaceae bacterium K14]